ncbi:MAG: NAD(P)H-dependent oxidoreductase subunit E, partial [Methylococcaceae bacterium]
MNTTDTDIHRITQDILMRHPAEATALMPVLRAIQSTLHHIPRHAMSLVSTALSVPFTQIQGVAEFYAFFSTEPVGRYDIRLSDSISDHLLGSRELGAYLAQSLSVRPGETREDGCVSFDYTACTGLCDQGPAGLVNGYALSRLDRNRVDHIVKLVNHEVPLCDWPAEFFQVEDNIRRTDLLLDDRYEP